MISSSSMEIEWPKKKENREVWCNIIGKAYKYRDDRKNVLLERYNIIIIINYLKLLIIIYIHSTFLD
jgi:hypothetical protein